MEQEEEEITGLSWAQLIQCIHGTDGELREWTKKGRDSSKVTLLAQGGARTNTQQGSMAGFREVMNQSCMGSKSAVLGQL